MDILSDGSVFIDPNRRQSRKKGLVAIRHVGEPLEVLDRDRVFDHKLCQVTLQHDVPTSLRNGHVDGRRAAGQIGGHKL